MAPTSELKELLTTNTQVHRELIPFLLAQVRYVMVGDPKSASSSVPRRQSPLCAPVRTIDDEAMGTLRLRPSTFHGNWNYAVWPLS